MTRCANEVKNKRREEERTNTTSKLIKKMMKKQTSRVAIAITMDLTR
jgi:hypothetical protein